MEQKILGIFLTLILALLGLIAFSDEIDGKMLRSVPSDPPKTVDFVDINQYLGKWYEQSVIPNFWENGCIKTTATYSLNEDKTIKVQNHCIRNGKESGNTGKATPEDDTNAKLKLQFIQSLDISGHYWVVRLAKDYSYAAVSSPDYKYLFILYREPIMP